MLCEASRVIPNSVNWERKIKTQIAFYAVKCKLICKSLFDTIYL